MLVVGLDFAPNSSWSRTGWQFVRQQRQEKYWRKPDAKSGYHATTNWNGLDRLKVFTTVLPVLPPKSYDKFQYYARTKHNGEFSTAAKELASLGYGAKTEPSKPTISAVPVGQTQDLGVPTWPALDEAALLGIIGEFVNKAIENSEADPAAVLLTLLPALGIVIGSDTYFEVGDTKHPARLNTLLVGATSRARKGTSAGPVERALEMLPLGLSIRVTPGPVASGEGLIYHVRDAGEQKGEDGQPIDPGVLDKRLLVIEQEYGRTLKAMNKDNSTLATTIRAAFDRGNLDPLTKFNRIKATGAHIGIVGHITNEELQKDLKSVEIFSGTMNRSLIGCARRSKEVPRPLPLDTKWLEDYVGRLSTRLIRAQNLGAVEFSSETASMWDIIYSTLTRDEPGLIGALICRNEALTLRLGLLYAVLGEWEDRPLIQPKHLQCALAVIAYSNDSVRYLYGSPQMDNRKEKLCQRILTAVCKSPENKLTQTELHEALGKKISGNDLRNALMQLQSAGKLTQAKRIGGPSKGATATTWSIADGFEIRVSEFVGNDEIDD